MPHRAHVHGRGPPAEDARDDHGRVRGGPARGARRAAAAPAGGLRGPVRGDGGPAGHDPAARPAAARVPARPSRRSRRRSSARASSAAPTWRSWSRRSTACTHLAETNPMLGTRGVRLGILHPEIYEMQVARDRPRRAARCEERTGEAPKLEIMIPLVAYEQELELMRELVEGVVRRGATARASSVDRRHDDRAAAGVLRRRPDRRGRRLLLVRHERPDADRARLLARRRRGHVPQQRYIERKIVDRIPFETIDQPGVGWLVRLAAWVGREAKPDLKLGICGEHGGDPESIEFFQMAGPRLRVAARRTACRSRASRRRRPRSPCCGPLMRALRYSGDEPLATRGRDAGRRFAGGARAALPGRLRRRRRGVARPRLPGLAAPLVALALRRPAFGAWLARHRSRRAHRARRR